MERKHSWRRFLLVALLAAWPTGCGESSDGTFVKLKFDGVVSKDKPIQRIAVDLVFNGQTATTWFPAPTEAGIALPTDGVLEIQSGEGTLDVYASALASDNTLLGQGQGTGTVSRGTTAEIAVTFGATYADAGVPADGPVGPDGPAPGLDAATQDLGTDRPPDVPITPDGPLEAAGPPDIAPDSIGPDAAPDVLGTGGAIGPDAKVDRPGGGGAGGSGGSGGAGGSGGSTGAYLLTVEPPSIDFGLVAPGSSSPPQTFTIINKGDAPTPPLSLFISDTKTFAIDKDTCTSARLLPAQVCNVIVTFRPSAPGSVRADGVVAPADNAGIKFQLSGTGAGGPATLSLAPATMHLPVVDVNTKTPTDFTLTNGGDTDAGTITIQVVGSPSFQLTNNGCTGILSQRSQCIFTVMFSPGTYGPATATVTATSSLGLSASASISGTGRDYVPLTIAFAGTGAGTVNGGPQSCPSGATCNFSIPRTDPNSLPKFNLTAEPANLYTLFEGWSGACAGPGDCLVIMDTARSVTATFNPRTVQISITVVGFAGHQGKVVSTDGLVECKDNCPNLSHPATESFTLLAEPASGTMTFVAWAGRPCRGASPQCTFPLTEPVSIIATFGPQSYVFVSSDTVVPGLVGGIEGADRHCSMLAQQAGLPDGKYVAWLSTASDPANERVGQGGWFRTDGRPFARDIESLTNPGALVVYYPPRVDEHGNDLGNVRTWVATGTNADGSPGGSLCKDYTSTTGALIVGDAASGSNAWTNKNNDPAGCGKNLHLYCFSANSNVMIPIIPPLAEGRLAFVSRDPFLIRDSTTTPDLLCANEAGAKGLPADRYLAFIATTQTPAIARFNLDGPPWRRADGVLLTQIPSDLADGKLLAPIDLTLDGKIYTTATVWTGASSPSTPGTAASTCNNWMDPGSSSAAGTVGDSQTSAAMDWFKYTTNPCASSTTHVLCLEK
ncbi:MAG: choice-of-anchor D domain-containing protein [Deltaproteobacteria bacterium]|nr:choice-of-anchor D domain-containing protein [Deltaproteobacteria bacterium]